jgi:hypothetical protein
MDPIHPIVPQSPTLPPVTPSPRAEGVNRDGARPGAERERRRRAARDRAAKTDIDGLATGEDDESDDPGETRPRIDITA